MIKYEKIVYILLSLIIIIAYFLGALEIIGIDQTISKLMIQFLIVVLFIFALKRIYNDGKFHLYSGLIIGLIGLLFTILISFLINDYNYKYLILFIKELVFPILFFISLINIKLPKLYLKKLLIIIIVLALIQIVATIIKLFSIGLMEKYIGTMSVGQGSLATIFPLMAISFIWSNFLYTNKKRFLLYILLFLIIGLASKKLGIIPYTIIIIVMLSIIRYSLKDLFKFKIYKNIIIVVSISLIIIYSFGRLNPRISVGKIIGGNFDKIVMIDFFIKYMTRDKNVPGFEQTSRLAAISKVFNKIEAEGNSHIAFGMGPGHIVKSQFNRYEEPIRDIYNIGYGARTGFLWFFIQIGLIGVIFFTIIHLKLFQILLKYNKNKFDYQSKVMILTSIGFSLVFLLDYFTYSSVIIIQPTAYITYYYIIYYGISTSRIKMN